MRHRGRGVTTRSGSTALTSSSSLRPSHPQAARPRRISSASAVRAGIYARISCDREGDQLGVTRQIEDCRRLAERCGYVVDEVYVDDGRRPSRQREMFFATCVPACLRLRVCASRAPVGAPLQRFQAVLSGRTSCKSPHRARIPHEQRDAPGKNRTCARGLGSRGDLSCAGLLSPAASLSSPSCMTSTAAEVVVYGCVRVFLVDGR